MSTQNITDTSTTSLGKLGPDASSASLSERRSEAKANSLIRLDYKKLLFIFALGSIAGLALEMVYHLVVYGALQNRFGLVWGPFSPLYGVGALLFTVVLNPLTKRSNGTIFFASAVVGTAVEYICSVGMEHFFGAVCWDYSEIILNIDGRINLPLTLIWGLLGLAWARLALPWLKQGFEQVDWKSAGLTVVSVILSVYLVVNIAVTLQAFDRESERVRNIPAASSVDVFMDEHFSSEWMQTRFENMSIQGTTK